MFTNLILVPGFFYAFWIGLCERFDGHTNTSFFVLLIPLWLIAIPLFIFTVLNGLATQNNRANKCEKISLSLMVPCIHFTLIIVGGFFVTFVLLLLYAEKILSIKVFILLIPNFVSIICLYLYLRCLIKPLRVQAKISNEPNNQS